MSQISIINNALQLLGCNRLTSMTDNTPEAKAASNTYNDSLKTILSECCWSFASKRVSLNKIANKTPEWTKDGKNTYFQLPSDFVEVFEVSDENALWEIEGESILANVSELGIKYVYFLTDASKYSASFVDAFIYKLASDMCYELTNSGQMTDELLKLYRSEFLPLAKSKNARQKSSPKIKDDAWINAIYRGVQG